MDFWRHQRLLIIAPHADDETFGCGGLMAKVKAAGGAVFVIVASVGDLHQYGVDEPGDTGRTELAGVTARPVQAAGAGSEESAPGGGGGPARTLVAGATRIAELGAAMATLRVDGYEVLFTDQALHLRLDTVPTRDLIAFIERDARFAIDRTAPTVLVLPACTYNQDHEALFKAGLAAARPHLPEHRPFIPIVLASDAPQLAWYHQPFQPNLFVDISQHLETKLRAHACHRSQLKPPPHHASLENLDRLARVRGAEISVQAAEAFRCLRFVL